jgi:integrase
MYYYVPNVREPGRPARIPLGREFAEAMAAYGKLVGRPAPLATLDALFERYQLEVIPLKAPRTQRDNLKELALLRAYFGQMRPEDLEPRHVYQYMDDRKAPVRANREKALLSHVCTYAIRWGVLRVNPCRDVKRNPEYARDRYITDTELHAFKEVAPPLLRVYVDFKYATAMRKSDILGLRLAQLTDEGIEYYEAKKRRRRRITRAGQLVLEEVKPRKRLVRWTAELRAIVERARALPHRAGEDRLFIARDGRLLTTSRFDAVWQRAMRKAVAKGVERFTEHDLRAKSATDAPETAQQRLGHTTAGQTKSYMRRIDTDAYDPIPLPAGRQTRPEAKEEFPLQRRGNVIPFPGPSAARPR